MATVQSIKSSIPTVFFHMGNVDFLDDNVLWLWSCCFQDRSPVPFIGTFCNGIFESTKVGISGDYYRGTLPGDSEYLAPYNQFHGMSRQIHDDSRNGLELLVSLPVDHTPWYGDYVVDQPVLSALTVLSALISLTRLHPQYSSRDLRANSTRDGDYPCKRLGVISLVITSTLP